MSDPVSQHRISPKELGMLLLEIGAALLEAGANCRRIKLTMQRISIAYGFELHTTIGPKSVTLTLLRQDDEEVFNGTRSIAAQGVNFKMVSGLSRMSWSIAEQEWTLDAIRVELARLKGLPHYNRLLILLTVGVAGAAFCYTAGGSWREMAIAFGATVAGLIVKQELAGRRVNVYVCTYLGAAMAGLFTALFAKAGIELEVEHAFATSVLFLIPGVPLINSLTDLIYGEILIGLERGANALIHTLAIASGLSTVMYVLSFHL